MKQVLVLLWFFCVPMLIQAADIPDVVKENSASAQQMCVDRALNDCINTICPNSPDINCPDNCQKSAQARCNGQNNE